MKTALVIFSLVVGITPHLMLLRYEYIRWKDETGRQGWVTHHWDFAYKRAARRSGRAYLQIITLGWFAICWIGMSFV